MSFFPFSLILSYEIVIRRPEKTTETSNRQESPAKETPCSSLQHSVASNSSERFLSPSTQQLQQQIRDRIRAQREGIADADSLSCLEAADAVKRRREQTERLRERRADTESLSVLMRVSAEIEGRPAKAESSARTSSRRPSWSSFGDIRTDTPSPSPRVSSSPDPKEEADDPFDGAGPQNEFARSLMEQRQLREASIIWHKSSEHRSSSHGKFAELLKYYEELEARV